MREEKFDRVTNWSWISTQDKVYAFKLKIKKHLLDDAAKLLGNFLDRERKLGYEVNEKEETVTAQQGEKLALVFRLLNTPNEAEIRIIKRIGICRDCHNYMKCVSVLTSRIIVVRDSKKLHKIFQRASVIVGFQRSCLTALCSDKAHIHAKKTYWTLILIQNLHQIQSVHLSVVINSVILRLEKDCISVCVIIVINSISSPFLPF